MGEASVALSDGGASLEVRDGQVRVYVADGLAIVSNAGGRTEAAAGERVTRSANAAPQVEAVAFWDGLDQPAVVYVGDGMATSGERGTDALAQRLRQSMTFHRVSVGGLE